MPHPRVMFIHGLEGHPEGSKVVMLREQGLEVHAADMHMSLWRLDKHNSVLRNLLRVRELQLMGAGVLLGLGAGVAWSQAGLVLATLLAAGAWSALRREAWVTAAIRRSFDRCVEIQARAVVEYEPDLIVGSSWGGAVTAELLIRAVWSGPTILLAPAIRKVSERTQRTDPSEALAQLERAQPILVFHDLHDEVVPHADSVALGRMCGIELRSVEAGGHRLLELLERGELAAAIRACAAHEH